MMDHPAIPCPWAISQGRPICQAVNSRNQVSLCYPVTSISYQYWHAENFAVVKSNTNFDLVVNLNNFEAGAFANPSSNFLGAPQQLGERGTILGYIRLVIQEVDTFRDLNPIDPNIFAFFRSANSIAVDGAVRTTVATGLANGTYRIAAMMTTSNHQPILFPVEQRGAAHDVVYVCILLMLSTVCFDKQIQDYCQ
ncbi:MAG TPA: hypothetical protein VGO47_07245 [Chlamydiales bacterium]|nr:hypothetical protein [Chlamydiales bacterium]